MRSLFTSESVTEGHPDKVCDRISDSVLDECLKQDPYSRVACETTCASSLVMCVGEITTNAAIDIQQIARDAIREIGYDKPEYGFDCGNCTILTSIRKQSPDIAMGVDNSLESKSSDSDSDIGAGDQGMMFGFACDETPVLMPMPIYYAHKLTRKLSGLRKSGGIGYLRPDGKSQVTVEYENGEPIRIHTVVISTQHDEDVSQETIRSDLIEKCIGAVIPSELIDDKTIILINPTGRFVIGGPCGDSGLTGRKIIVDTYGGYSRHGGGSFSGKDPTKVDRSAAYAARYAAKNVIAAGLARKCEIQLAYAIGVAKPVSLFVDTFGTGIVPDDKLAEAIGEVFDFRPSQIIKDLDLRKPIYKKTSAYGHMGREDVSLPWERTDRTALLRSALNI